MRKNKHNNLTTIYYLASKGMVDEVDAGNKHKDGSKNKDHGIDSDGKEANKNVEEKDKEKSHDGEKVKDEDEDKDRDSSATVKSDKMIDPS